MNQEIDCILAGVLANLDDISSDHNRVVFVNNQQEIQFSIKIISKVPKNIAQDQIVICYANKFKDFGWEDNYYENWPKRANDFESFLQDWIILFKPLFRQSKGTVFLLAEPLAILPRPPIITRQSFLLPMLHLTGEESAVYEKRLLQKEPIAPFRYYPWDMPESKPVYVYVNGYLYGNVTEQARRMKKWVFEHEGDIRRASCDLSKLDGVLLFEEVAFVEEGVYNDDFRMLLDAEGEVIISPVKMVAKDAAAQETTDNGMIKEIFENKYSVAEATGLDSPTNYIQDTITEEPETQMEPREEEIFLDYLKKYCRSLGLYYDEEDLLNLHIAIKAGGLLVLAGMSGTGKSRLVKVYAEALGLSGTESGRMLFIPVRPTWADDTDLIGFLDTANHLYRPAETGLVNLLAEAEKNPDDLYMVCFDEMNLARVEHYFAKFLSILELPMGERVLQLYNPDLVAQIYNSYHYPPQIKVGSNVIFVGTVNVDESTYSFSDKVLDRSNILKLKILPFKSTVEEESELTTPKAKLFSRQFLQWVRRGGKQYSLSPHELGFFDELREAIQRADANKGVSHRCLRQVELYLLNIPRTIQGPLLSRARAFDFQLKQKVLPLLRGPQQQLLKLIGKFNETTGEVEESELSKILDDYANISDFVNSREEIKQKARELRWYGYASQ